MSNEETIRDLRDAIRLMIGQHIGTPWTQIPETEVDAYVNAIRRLKQLQSKIMIVLEDIKT